MLLILPTVGGKLSRLELEKDRSRENVRGCSISQ